MSNFDFVKWTLPGVHGDCVRAESYLTNDPRTACFYARRVVEGLVNYLYEVLNLPSAYRDDLAAKISEPAFGRYVPPQITQRLSVIRQISNIAVHDNKPITPDVATKVLKDLFSAVVWVAYHHSAQPQNVPLQSQFDPALARKSAPLSREELVRLAEKFQKQDEQHARELSAKDAAHQAAMAAHEAEIAKLREQIAIAQAQAAPDTRDYSEVETRDLFIDLLLHEAGWPLDKPADREYEVAGMPTASGRGNVDYVLWGNDGRPLAIVEAKRTKKSPEIGKQQAKLYADCLENQFGQRPVIFYTNGYEHWLWDDAGGYPPRQVQGFYTKDELELLIQRRRTRQALAKVQVNAEIAGRPYQMRAIKAVAEAFDHKQRDALLVMATGSGKTRTVIALVDLLQKANWAKRILFLADRTALVNQAVNAFKKQLPNTPTVNLVTERNSAGRVYVSTYQTVLNLINQVQGLDSATTPKGSAQNDGEAVRRKFGPGFFDLIIIDEAHRSVYQKYGAIFQYFDALLVGLTATPKDEVDHNTYRLFHLEDGVPTDSYSLAEAVYQEYLVPPKAVSVGTKFLRTGIKYAELSEREKDDWDALDWGGDDPPDEVNAEQLNRFLFNEDTVDKVLATLMTDGYKVAGGDRLGKTIIFAKNQKHAEFIEKRFNYAYPEYGGQFARVITAAVPYAQSLIDDFSQKEKAPHIAISVDMLDTGIDVPEVLNLVFFKTIHAKTKFWQMIGRGTRLCPDLFGPGRGKQDFLVFDFCGNLEYFSQDLPAADGVVAKPLSQRLFEARLDLVKGLDSATPLHSAQNDGLVALRIETAELLYGIVAGMNLENFLVRPHRKVVEKFAKPQSWEIFTPDDLAELSELSVLPSTVRDTDEKAKRFDLLILRGQLANLQGDTATAERVRLAVQGISTSLLGKLTIPDVKAQAELLADVAGDEWWENVTLPMLAQVRRKLRGLVYLAEKESLNPVYTDFQDTLGEATTVTLPGVTPGVNQERFESKVGAYLRQHLDNIALQKLRRNKQLTSADLAALQRILNASGVDAAQLTNAVNANGGLGRFIRKLVGLEPDAVKEAFEKFLSDGSYSANQIRFINLIVDELTKNGTMEPARLFESPFMDIAPTGPDMIFAFPDVEVIVDTLNDFNHNMYPPAA